MLRGLWGGGGEGGGTASVAQFVTRQEQAQLNRLRYFHFIGVCLASNGANYSDLI